MIKRKGHLSWGDLQIGSGFDLELQYSKKVSISGAEIGVTDDFDLTSPLARFLQLNYGLIKSRLPLIEQALFEYRKHQRKECSWKSEVMSYRFLTDVYSVPRQSYNLREDCEKHERDLRVRKAIEGHERQLEDAYERFSLVTENETSCWWYIFWVCVFRLCSETLLEYPQDDFWRRNHDTVPPLSLHEADFNPWFASSIAYTPLPRAALEAFLVQRGLMSKIPKRRDFLNPGILNKIYLRLNDTVFRESSRVGDFGLLFVRLSTKRHFFRPFYSTWASKVLESTTWKVSISKHELATTSLLSEQATLRTMIIPLSLVGRHLDGKECWKIQYQGMLEVNSGFLPSLERGLGLHRCGDQVYHRKV